jgi:hypothetical protein
VSNAPYLTGSERGDTVSLLRNTAAALALLSATAHNLTDDELKADLDVAWKRLDGLADGLERTEPKL